MKTTGRKFTLFILSTISLGLISSGCQSLRIGPGKPPLPETLSLIESYFDAEPEHSETILEEFRGKDFYKIEKALRFFLAHRNGENAPVGTRPGRSIHLGAERMTYGLFVPSSYNPERAYPLIICLHGAGFSGDSYLDRWKPRLGDDFILACPSIRSGNWWTIPAEQLILAVIDEVSRIYHIDTDRVVLTGMSNGGNGTFLIGLNYADRFAALAPMAGAFPEPLYPLFENARTVPFYILHGSEDQVMPVEYSRRAAAYLKENGRSFVYREHKRIHPMAGGHFFPREELPRLVKWLKKRKRNPVPRSLVLVRDRDHTGRLFWIRIDDIAREAGSFWASAYYPEEGKLLKEGAYARVTAEVSDNRILVSTERIRHLTLLLHPALVDFSRPVEVVVNGETIQAGPVKPSLRTLMTEARKRPDPRQLVWAEIQIPLSP